MLVLNLTKYKQLVLGPESVGTPASFFFEKLSNPPTPFPFFPALPRSY